MMIFCKCFIMAKKDKEAVQKVMDSLFVEKKVANQ